MAKCALWGSAVPECERKVLDEFEAHEVAAMASVIRYELAPSVKFLGTTFANLKRNLTLMKACASNAEGMFVYHLKNCWESTVSFLDEMMLEMYHEWDDVIEFRILSIFGEEYASLTRENASSPPDSLNSFRVYITWIMHEQFFSLLEAHGVECNYHGGSGWFRFSKVWIHEEKTQHEEAFHNIVTHQMAKNVSSTHPFERVSWHKLANTSQREEAQRKRG